MFRVCVAQNCILGGIRGYLFAFCRQRAPSADSLFSTRLAKVRTTYRSALTKCAQITHIVPPVTVQPLAMWLSVHLIQNFFLWAPIFRVCVTQNGNLDGIRGHTHTRVCIAICIQRPIARYVMGGGWDLLDPLSCNRYRGTRL